MSSTTPYVYTELDPTTQMNAIKARIRDLEQQYLNISLRVNAPGVGDPVTAQDQSNLATLTGSLETLHSMESAISPGS